MVKDDVSKVPLPCLTRAVYRGSVSSGESTGRDSTTRQAVFQAAIHVRTHTTGRGVEGRHPAPHGECNNVAKPLVRSIAFDISNRHLTLYRSIFISSVAFSEFGKCHAACGRICCKIGRHSLRVSSERGVINNQSKVERARPLRFYCAFSI